MNKEKKITLKIEIDEDTYKKLELQLESFKTNPIAAEQYGTINSVEELVTILTKNLATANDEFSKVQDKMEDVLKTFKEKGVDLNEIFGKVFDKVNDKKETAGEKENKELKKKIIYKKD